MQGSAPKRFGVLERVCWGLWNKINGEWENAVSRRLLHPSAAYDFPGEICEIACLHVIIWPNIGYSEMNVRKGIDSTLHVSPGGTGTAIRDRTNGTKP